MSRRQTRSSTSRTGRIDSKWDRGRRRNAERSVFDQEPFADADGGRVNECGRPRVIESCAAGEGEEACHSPWRARSSNFKSLIRPRRVGNMRHLSSIFDCFRRRSSAEELSKRQSGFNARREKFCVGLSFFLFSRWPQENSMVPHQSPSPSVLGSWSRNICAMNAAR